MVAAYFCYFAAGSLAVKFAPDDLMNLDYYWKQGPAKMLLALVAPWRGGYRPFGAVYYLPLFRWFGLNPAPYHFVTLLLLAANAYLVYRLARALRLPETAAGLAALLVCYHAGLSFLYYNTSFIYDVLCTFFYLAAFVYYARRRAEGGTLSRGQLAVFLALYWCALNSKEMAVTMPAVLIAYEWLYEKRPSVRVAIWTAVLAAPIVLRVVIGSGALVQIPDYQPEFSAARLAAFQRDAFSDFFLTWHFFTTGWALAVWAVLTLVAWWPKRPALRFCWWWLVLTPIPIEFLSGRTNACLALPFCGLAVLAAGAFTELAGAVSERVGGRAAFAAIVAAGVCFWAVRNAELKHRLIVPQMGDLGKDTWAAITGLEALHADVRPHSTVIFLNDPFEDFDMAFIAELCFRQPDVYIKLRRKTPVGDAELAKADHLIGYEGGRLILVR